MSVEHGNPDPWIHRRSLGGFPEQGSAAGQGSAPGECTRLGALVKCYLPGAYTHRRGVESGTRLGIVTKSIRFSIHVCFFLISLHAIVGGLPLCFFNISSRVKHELIYLNPLTWAPGGNR